MSSIYISFYVNFIAENARNGNIIFSPSRQLFVSRVPGKVKAEDYTDLSGAYRLCLSSVFVV
jgi:hypothetical protein